MQFDENEKAMFQVVARQSEVVFFLLTSPKCDLGEVEKATLQEVACHFELIFGLLTILKCVLDEVGKATFQGTLNLFWTCGLAKNAFWMKWKKRCFKVSNGILNLFSDSGLTENAI